MYKRQFTTWVITNKERTLFANEIENFDEMYEIQTVDNILWADEFDTKELAEAMCRKHWETCEELGLTKIIQIETTIKEKRKTKNVSK